ncbi:glycosyltransferase [Escherichia albertii]|uniref:Predicted glycosyltransferase family 4 n=1 Tax=Escherichia albertii TaxID=208962 RepID=A0A5A4U4W2_ESCAL|nr:glycosyltransferase [Escherichia albertii]MCZ9242432.1 glycosyltransferase [Escherichia albertii]MCZ9250514.1 glycosyltransferase [Escherichia albertii]BBM62769.1 predicted glycosyltransferase family 4 [Escherichia albertii]
MKLKIISYSLSKGGAAKAAKNFLYLASKHKKYEPEMISVWGTLRNGVLFRSSALSIFVHYLKMSVSRLLTYFAKNDKNIKHSLNLFDSNYVAKHIDCSLSQKDVIHINWVNNDTISLFSLKKLFEGKNKKIILTLHDEWFYSASEHYAEYNSLYYVFGYDGSNFINRYIFDLKKKINFDNIVITVPSYWMYERAKKSLLLRNSDIHILPNYIDTDVFTELKDIRSKRHKKLNIPKDAFIIGFGAVSGGTNPLKGFDLLVAALDKVLNIINDKNRIVLLTFGANDIDKRVKSLGCDIINMGVISSSHNMAEIYNYLDVMIVPSRVESFGQVAAESLACKTPVIAFNYSGIKDIVIHQRNGLLAEPFSVDSLALNISLFMGMTDKERYVYGENGRDDVIHKFGETVVSKTYFKLIDYVKGVEDE